MDGEVTVGDVGQSGITGRGGGKMTVVLEEADERVLVVIVHVGDDASLRSCLLGGRVSHNGVDSKVLCTTVCRVVDNRR